MTELLPEIAELLFHVYHHFNEDALKHYPNVGIVIHNNTKILIKVGSYSTDTCEWEPRPYDIRSGGESLATATKKNPAGIVGYINYKAEGSEENIMEITFKSPFIIGHNEYTLNMSQYWHDQGYRMFYIPEHNSEEYWFTVMLVRTFLGSQSDTRIPNGYLDTSPSVVVFDEKVYVFYRRKGTWSLRYIVSVKGTYPLSWDEEKECPDTMLVGSPSAVVYDGKIWVFHQGNDDGCLFYNVLSADGSWAGDKMVSGLRMSNSPSAAVFGNKIYVAHQGNARNGELWHIWYDGHGWSQDMQISGSCSESPALVVYKETLYCFYQWKNLMGTLYYVKYNGTGWDPEKQKTGTHLSLSPAAVVYNKKLYLFHQAAQNIEQIWCTVFDGENWEDDAQLPDLEGRCAPSGVVFKEKIHCFHQGSRGFNELWYVTINRPAT